VAVCANTFIAAQGHNVGKFVIGRKPLLPEAKRLMQAAKD